MRWTVIADIVDESSEAYRTGYFIGTYVLVPALVLAIVYFYIWVPRWVHRFLRHLDTGNRRRAYLELQRYGKPLRTKSVRKANQPRVLARVLGLWLLDDLDDVRADLARYTGDEAFRVNVEMFGLLALATASADRGAMVARLEELAARTTKDAPNLRERAARVARLGAALAGQPLSEADAKEILDRLYAEPVLTRVLVLRAMILAGEAAGRPSLRLQKMLAQLTRHFSQAAA